MPEKINFLKRNAFPMKKKKVSPSDNQERRKQVERLIQAKGTIELPVDLDILRDRKTLFEK